MKSMTRPIISKTSFTRGDDCSLATVYSVTHPEEATQPDMQYIFDNGERVGIMARNLFPGAVTVEYDKYENRARHTQDLIESGVQTICEAAFLKDGLFAAADIICVKSDKHVILYEVKSSTEIKDIFYRDLAFQTFLIEKCGYHIDEANIVYVNKDFVKNGSIDPKEFFVIENVSVDVRNLLTSVESEINEIQNDLYNGIEIDSPPFGQHCFTPYACPFWNKCKKHLPQDSIFDIKGSMRTSTKVKLYYDGVTDMKAFLGLKRQNPKYVQQARLQVEKNDEIEVKMEELKSFLDTLEFPLTSLDFETIAPSIPVFDGTGPYDQIVTQFSAHVLNGWCGALKHFEFLANPEEDWRSDVAHQLVKACPSTGSIIVWNKTMEYNRIMEMAEMPCNADIKDELTSIAVRIVDLMVPFKNRIVYNRAMQGSYSLKYVLPALCPSRRDLSYTNLSVNNGMLASQVFSEMIYGKMSKIQVAATRRDLLTYCELDTYGPFHILNKLYYIVDPDCKTLFVSTTIKRDHTQRTLRVGDYVTTNVGNGTIIGFTPCFVRIRLEKHKRHILRMAHNLYNHSGLNVPSEKSERIPASACGNVTFYDVTGKEVKIGNYVITGSQLGQVVGRTDFFLKIQLSNGKIVRRNGTFTII